MIRRSAEHLSGLIDGLLDISKIEAGRLQIERNEVRLAELLDQIEGMFRLQARAKGLDFRFEPAANLPAVVRTDEKRLRQILINLLSNAVKFTGAGHVALRLTYRNAVATLIVEDSGPGIAATDLERIFEPFDRGAVESRHAIPGLGLGLTITKLLTQLMGGAIAVESTPGQGSRFEVRLMLSAVTRPLAAPVRHIGGYRGIRRTILVADDDPDHQAIMREALTPLGFSVLAARDGPTCLALVADISPDLFLLDIAMPGLSGWELVRALRAGAHARTPIIMLSANIGDLRPVRADGEGGPDAILPKPFNLHRLLDEIERLLELDWIAEPLPPPVPVPVAPGRPVLGADTVDELLAMARIGYVRGLDAKLTELGGDPAHAPLIGRLRRRLDGFDLAGFAADLAEGVDG